MSEILECMDHQIETMTEMTRTSHQGHHDYVEDPKRPGMCITCGWINNVTGKPLKDKMRQQLIELHKTRNAYANGESITFHCG